MIAGRLGAHFNKIAEDLVDKKLYADYPLTMLDERPDNIQKMRVYLSDAYKRYQKLLVRYNCLDFSHMQKCAYNLLTNPSAAPAILKDIRYVLVDEYQDTNYIQEKILQQLVSATDTHNLCVVGDEDQALYRFRGATVRNILEFTQKFPGRDPVHLLTNYRSHHSIIDIYNKWMETLDWSNPAGAPFRSEKCIVPQPDARVHTSTDSVYAITYPNPSEEAEQFVCFVRELMEQGKIEDYSQVALLLRSVKPDYSGAYIQALEQAGIPYYCPRTRSYFAQDDVILLIGCLARILSFKISSHTESEEIINEGFTDYLVTCEQRVRIACQRFQYLLRELQSIQEEIDSTVDHPDRPGQPLGTYFYRLLTVKPFLDVIKDTEKYKQQLHNLERISHLLAIFEHYYHHGGLTQEKLDVVARDFFLRFLAALHMDGLNLVEDGQEQLPAGHIPILTIHQAKGLEFPIVVVGCLDNAEPYRNESTLRALQGLSPLQAFEPEYLIPSFDQHRLYYVAFSRAQNLLLLTASRAPSSSMMPLWRALPQWQAEYIRTLPVAAARKDPFTPYKQYSLTNHIQFYNTCPRQYQFFRYLNFAPSSSRVYLSGQLVHQTLEHIHRIAVDEQGLAGLTEQRLTTIFEQMYSVLQRTQHAMLDEQQKRRAWLHIQRYVEQNQDELRNVQAAELPVQARGNGYVLTGQIDLLVKRAQGPVLIDFKTQPRVEKDASILEQYTQQLYFYAHALERSRNQRPTQLFLYWTAEERKENALMEIPYTDRQRAIVDQDVQETADNIQAERFHVRRPPAPAICRACDLRYLCRKEKLIS
jgi:DNA helicase-2/ATP-dependent DNA helicase PcrA